MSASYRRPSSLADALSALADGRHEVLAGGTDFYPRRLGQPLTGAVVDITAVKELSTLVCSSTGTRIGAACSWQRLRDADLPPALRALQLAAREVGGQQIQTAGTLGGNLCNASPAADGVPALLALDATVEVQAATGTRELPLAQFLLGSRRTALRPGELLTGVHLPPRSPHCVSTFMKLGARRYLVISIVMVAVVLDFDTELRVSHAGISVGACSPVACRLPLAEQALLGAQLEPGVEARLEARHLAPLAPIDDVRAPAAYRRHAALALLRRAVASLAAEAAFAGAGP